MPDPHTDQIKKAKKYLKFLNTIADKTRAVSVYKPRIIGKDGRIIPTDYLEVTFSMSASAEDLKGLDDAD